MLSKKQFIQRLTFLMEYEERCNKFSDALEKFAPSDFTGFYDEKTSIHLLDNLKEDMNDETDVISWWLYDCPNAGKNPEHAKIWLGDADDENTEVVTVKTKEDLYAYLVMNNFKTPSKESMLLTVKSQDNGVKFALNELEKMKLNNLRTQNEGWRDRDAIVRFIQTQIENQYRFQRGIGADLDLNKPLHIISMLEEEECES